MIKYAEYVRERESFKNMEFTIPQNELDIIMKAINIDPAKSLPQTIDVQIPNTSLPEVKHLLDKYVDLKNVTQIKNEIEKYGYSSTSMWLFLYNQDNINFSCRIGKPKEVVNYNNGNK